MNIYETFKKLGWKARVMERNTLVAEFREVYFIGGARGVRRTRKQVIAAAERDLASGNAKWLDKSPGGFYKILENAGEMKFSSSAEMALKLTAMGLCE